MLEPVEIDPVEVVQSLSTSVDDLTGSIDVLRKQITKNRRQFRRALLLLVAALVVVASFAYIGNTASIAKGAASKAVSSSQANWTTCVANNNYRAGSQTLWESEESLWTLALGFYATPNETAATKAAISQVNALISSNDAKIKATFAPRNCGPKPA